MATALLFDSISKRSFFVYLFSFFLTKATLSNETKRNRWRERNRRPRFLGLSTTTPCRRRRVLLFSPPTLSGRIFFPGGVGCIFKANETIFKKSFLHLNVESLRFLAPAAGTHRFAKKFSRKVRRAAASSLTCRKKKRSIFFLSPPQGVNAFLSSCSRPEIRAPPPRFWTAVERTLFRNFVRVHRLPIRLYGPNLSRANLGASPRGTEAARATSGASSRLPESERRRIFELGKARREASSRRNSPDRRRSRASRRSRARLG